MISRLLFLFLFLSNFVLIAQQVETSTIKGPLDIDASNFLIQAKRVQNMTIDLSFRLYDLPELEDINSYSHITITSNADADTPTRYPDTSDNTNNSVVLLESRSSVSKLDAFEPKGITDFINANAKENLFSLILDE